MAAEYEFQFTAVSFEQRLQIQTAPASTPAHILFATVAMFTACADLASRRH
jgi:hypothetical protein